MTATIPPFDFDAMYAKVPTVWKERRLHWHCYSWRGTGADWANDSLRHTDSADITPSAVRAWLQKPQRLIRQICSTPEEAAEWEMKQWTRARAEALTTVPDWVSDDSHERASLYELRSGNDLSQGLWVKGQSMVSWAVIGTADACH
ncbi:hypothetical protein [Actinomadura litoris]|uniref:hypothetical protein n=1 Tax=Actinomadura litoris TaxID=2678616 RepID=UPI001FA7CD64|nr:hypothetical protein [Actinomadura litoris]